MSTFFLSVFIWSVLNVLIYLVFSVVEASIKATHWSRETRSLFGILALAPVTFIAAVTAAKINSGC